jgi:parallel beta-helix repeat protein
MGAIMKKTFRLLCALSLALAALSWLRVSPAQAFITSYSVNTLDDSHDSNLDDSFCYNADLKCSLRAAVEQASRTSSVSHPITINFDSLTPGTTVPLSLGMIKVEGSSITLDGGTRNITISGSTLPAATPILRFFGSYNNVTRLTFRNTVGDAIELGDFAGDGSGNHNTVTNSVFVGLQGYGVYILGTATGGAQNTISNNLMGMTTNNTYGCQSGDGIYTGVGVEGPAWKTLIQGNWIGCSINGIKLKGDTGGPVQTAIQENYIGLNQTGAMPNEDEGISDEYGQDTEIVGNTISGNANGIYFFQSTGGRVTGNGIGVDASWAAAIPNENGVTIDYNSTGITIGGSASIADRNLISGNANYGVVIFSGSTGNTVDFNLIGVNSAGTAALPNGLGGVFLHNAGASNFIGSAGTSAMQIISGNGGQGILIRNTPGTIVGDSNRIGVGADGISPIGNSREGILLDGATNSTIFPLVVENNHGAGIAVIGATAAGNLITFMDNFGNGGLPVDLGNDGLTPNDAGDIDSGPNGLLNYPVITSVSTWTPLVVHGKTCAGCQVRLFRANGNPGENGGGGSFLSYTDADASGNWTATLPAGLTRWDVSMIAVDQADPYARPSSEMSPFFRAYLPLALR